MAYRNRGIGDLIPASGEGRALVEIKGHVGGKKGAGMRRSSYSRRRYNPARRLSNPVNYWSWPMIIPGGTNANPSHRWNVFDIGSNDAPSIEMIGNLSLDTPENSRFASGNLGASWSPTTVSSYTSYVPLNARLLYTSGNVLVSSNANDVTLIRLAMFKIPSELMVANVSSKPSAWIAGVEGMAHAWMWPAETVGGASEYSLDSYRAARGGRHPAMPIWKKDFLLIPRAPFDSATACNGVAARDVPIRFRHPTGNAGNSDSSGYAFFVGSRTNSGSTFETGGSYMLNLRTSYVV